MNGAEQEGADGDPVASRALAIVLMREVLGLLEGLDEELAAAHLQTAIDAVLAGARRVRPQGSC